MKRRSIYLLAAALLIGSNQLLLTGCQKDYDGQIEMLKNLIESGAINVDGLVKKVELIEKQIETLQEAAKEHAEFRDNIAKLTEDLDATKTDLQNQIDQLKDAMQNYDRNLEEMIRKAEEKFDAKLKNLSDQINQQIGEKYNELNQKIQTLQEQVNTMDRTYKLEIDEIKQRLDALEKQGTDITALKKQLADLQQLVNTNIKDIQGLKDDQKAQAQKLTDLENKVNAHIIAMDANFKKLTGDVEDLFTKYNELLSQIPDLGALKAQVAQNQKDIADLQLKYQELTGQLKDFVTAADVNKLLENYYNKVEIDKMLADLYAKLNNNALKQEDVKALIAEATKGIQDQVDAMKGELDALKQKVDDLLAKVSTLTQQVQSMKDVYDKLIADLTKRIEALENQGGGQPGVDLTPLKNQLAQLEQLVNTNIKDIQGLKGDQQAQAQKLADLENQVNAHIIAMDANFKNLTGRVDELFKKFEELLNQNPNLGDLSALKAQVAQNQKDIADLQLQYQALTGQLKDFVTAADVNKMLENYYNKAEIDKMLADLYAKLNNAPSQQDVQALIDEAKNEIQAKLDAMQGELDALKQQVNDLQTKVDQLFNRLQSLVILPQFSNHCVELKSIAGSNYQLTLNVKVNPANALQQMTELKNYFHIDSREAILSRAAGDAGPKFTVIDVKVKDASAGILTVIAQCQLSNVDPHANKMPFTVAVEFKNDSNNRSSEYVSVRFVQPQNADQTLYTFKSGSDVLKTAMDSGFKEFNKDNTYVRNLLAETANVDGTPIVQIEGSTPVFTTPVLGTSQAVPENKDIPVFYGLAAVYDPQGISHMELNNYISVNAIDGAISMKNNLAPGVTMIDLTGYKLVLSLQASKGGYNYGEPAYICVELQNKK
ncbi:chromosome segregation ATPase-like protein [gut metagenome]|uniref:Chromosome segregation ATPase-like protein n=1 Tax=gut metagenome TaxID=749906 RepID=J9GHJ2_9ZZZZ